MAINLALNLKISYLVWNGITNFFAKSYNLIKNAEWFVNADLKISGNIGVRHLGIRSCYVHGFENMPLPFLFCV